jgi:ribosomal 30S subunit maturation factor RimM
MPAQDIWVIRHEGKLNLIPAVKKFIKTIDTQNRKIVIELIEGLIDGYAPAE